MIGRFLLLARGQVRVRVTGASLPRFLNVCAQNTITLRQMKRTAWNELYATLSVADFRILRGKMGRTGCRVHIVRRRGAPFVASRLRTRYALWGGLLAAVLLCWVLCTHIWAIEQHIDAALPQAEIMQQLDELGVHIGVRRSAIDVTQIRWSMLRRYPEIRFIALNIEGNRLTVEARAATPHEELLDQQAVTRVVAARDGVVRTVRAQEGQPAVQAGDAVAAGDTLISGLVPPTMEGGEYRLVHARGEIEAYTSHQKAAIRALTDEKKTYTGKVRCQYALVFGNKRLNLYIGSGISAGTCDKIVETKELWLSESVVFPISLIVQRYMFYERTPRTQTADEVRVDMIARALGQIAEGMDGTITAHRERVTEQNGAAVLELSADAMEQIGVQALDDSTIPEAPPEKNGEEED
ncbi:MAG: sporulation protein YqfD [Agathobaculum sp.]|jgi:similar to stage IV sporulation protein|uniref:sporulation protein YqfD n=1 Tax=Agathobaculum sp. TaxID=2048138 RepID=UPI003D92F797